MFQVLLLLLSHPLIYKANAHVVKNRPCQVIIDARRHKIRAHHRLYRCVLQASFELRSKLMAEVCWQLLGCAEGV
jgi:hypothetical protein